MKLKNILLPKLTCMKMPTIRCLCQVKSLISLVDTLGLHKFEGESIGLLRTDNYQGPVVQNFVSLMLSLSPQFFN